MTTDQPWRDPRADEPWPGVWWHGYVAVVDTATGSTRWSARSQPGWQVALDSAAVVLVDPDGRVEVRDPLTGHIRISELLPELTLATAARGHVLYLQALDDSLVVRTERRSATEVRAYPLDTLTPAWEVTVDYAGGDGGVQAGPEFLHWYGQAGSQLLDLRTGQVHSVPEARGGWPRVFPDVIVFMGGGERVREVVDRATGQVLADPAGWRLVEPPTDAPAELLLTWASDAGTALSRLDLTTGDLTYLGLEPERLSGCYSFTDGLVCVAGQRLTLSPRRRVVVGGASAVAKGVEVGQLVRRQLQGAGRQIGDQVIGIAGAGDGQHVRALVEGPGQPDQTRRSSCGPTHPYVPARRSVRAGPAVLSDGGGPALGCRHAGAGGGG